jgi:hypothetical protein
MQSKAPGIFPELSTCLEGTYINVSPEKANFKALSLPFFLRSAGCKSSQKTYKKREPLKAHKMLDKKG